MTKVRKKVFVSESVDNEGLKYMVKLLPESKIEQLLEQGKEDTHTRRWIRNKVVKLIEMHRHDLKDQLDVKSRTIEKLYTVEGEEDVRISITNNDGELICLVSAGALQWLEAMLDHDYRFVREED